MIIFSVLKQYSFFSTGHFSSGLYLHTCLCTLSHTGLKVLFSQVSHTFLDTGLQSLRYTYFLAFFGLDLTSSSHLFMGSVWQFCFCSGTGNSLVNFLHLTAPLPSLSLCLPHSKSMPKMQVLSLTIFSSSRQYWCSRSIHWKSSLVVTYSKIIHSITDSVSNSGTSLHGVGLVHHLPM